MHQDPTAMHPPFPAAIVFDMDGTLLDSERIAQRTFDETCRAFALEPHPDVYRRCIGTRGGETQAVLRELYGPAFPLERFFTAWSIAYKEHAIDRAVPIKDGVLALLDACDEARIPMAVATSTRRSTAMSKLAKVDLLDRFRFVLCGDEVEHGKPHPQIYLEAALRLDIGPAQAWAIEDSDVGVRAAHAAGMVVFQIPDLHEPEADVRAFGHRIVGSMHEVLGLLRG
jgi:HAD superfamily hydrolase (TIGR01509 family)